MAIYWFRYRVPASQFLKGVFLPFTLISALFGGYPYFRNLFVFHNPVYPFFFGHKGVSEEQWQSLQSQILHGKVALSSVREFLLFHVDAYYIYVCAFLFVFLVFARKQRVFSALLVFAIVYLHVYWFFVDQLSRYRLDSIVLLLVGASLVIAEMFSVLSSRGIPLKQRVLSGFAPLAIILFFSIGNPQIWPRRSWDLLANRTYRWDYGLGRMTKTDYLKTSFGCNMVIADKLSTEFKADGVTLDNWSVWHDHSVHWFYTDNVFSRFAFNMALGEEKAIEETKRFRIKYVYVKESVKKSFLENKGLETDPSMKSYFQYRLEYEEFLIRNSKLVYSADDRNQKDNCKLYKVSFGET
jgi:hypothetical protein